MLLRELQDLQMWLLNRESKLSLIFTLCGNRKILASVVGITYHSVDMSERKPFNENVANLEDFIDFVKEKEYECKKTKKIKRQLERRGYKLYTKNLIGNEDYAYMKTTRYADGELKYIISHGFYDWEDDEGALENYGYTPTIVLGAAGSERIDVVLTEPEFSVEECEEIAEKLAEFFKPYFDKYIRNDR